MTTQIKKDINTIDPHILSGMNTSQKIRFLHSCDYSRGEIAKYLNKRYQHVRNVLVTPLTSK